MSHPATVRRWRRVPLVALLAIALAAVTLGIASAPAHAATEEPCDIYAAAGTPCVAAHSTTRALYAAYDGALYRVERASDDTFEDIGVLSAGGAADAAEQDSFCADTTCTITEVYDQSGHGNDLQFEGTGGAGGEDTASSATAQAISVYGQKAYALYINAGNAYWVNGSSNGVPTGSSPEAEYMVTSGQHYNAKCCFDYGNSETDRTADGDGAMDAINFGSECWFGSCTGSGPWVQADLEDGLFSGGSDSWNSSQEALGDSFVTAMLKNNGSTEMAIEGGNAQSGSLTTMYDGALPSGYDPMVKQGAITLGAGGDCCVTKSNGSIGTFYEGVIVSGYPTSATDAAVQANIVAANYSAFIPGTEISLQASTSCCTSDYIQHDASDDKVVLAKLTSSSSSTDKADADWIVEPGLYNSSCVSFESANESGEYLRHSNFELYLEPNDGTTLFSEDATFCPTTGNSGKGYSLQSVNYPSQYIRHYEYVVYIASDGGSKAWDTTTNWAADSSWYIASPWS
ncbi:MAG TPA: alpha-L-arabinofuranosidase B [Actinospica sp.]|nr:alpha-L-arabinofuranosidase B [Actinospica sp.]